MTTLQMLEQDILDAATRMDEAVAAVAAVDAGGRLPAVAAALPGASSAAAATTLGSTWTSEYAAWSRDGGEHAETTRSAAAVLTEADLRVAQSHGANVPVPQ